MISTMNSNSLLNTAVFGTHGFTPTQSPQRFPLKIEMVGGGSSSSGGSSGSSPESGGIPILPLLLIFGAIAGLVVVRSRNKGITKTQYIQSKVEQARNAYGSISGGASAKESITRAVEEFKASQPDLAASVSFTQSCVVGDFIAIKNMDGKLLAEVPYVKADDISKKKQ
jgi:hypothetical protein